VGGEADGGKKRWESESEHGCESGAVPEGTMTGLEGRVAGTVRWKQGKRRSSHDGEGRACQVSFAQAKVGRWGEDEDEEEEERVERPASR
jgi:hypothetical protein